MNLSQAVKTAKSIITANSPVLLVGTALAGVVTTGVLAARGGYKARGIVDDERDRRLTEVFTDTDAETFQEFKQKLDELPELTLQEKIKLTWLCYVAPAVTGVSTMASIVGVHTIHTKRHAALAGLYAVTTTKLDDYTQEAEKLLGPKKTQQLNDAVAQRDVDRNPPGLHEVVVVEGANELCYDEWSGRYFMGSMPIIEAAVANVNLMLAESGSASLNDFYDYVGLSPLPMGMTFGWNGGTRIHATFGSVTTPDGRSAIAYDFRGSNAPKENPALR